MATDDGERGLVRGIDLLDGRYANYHRALHEIYRVRDKILMDCDFPLYVLMQLKN